MKEEYFQDIASESKILDVVSDKEKDESMLKLEIPYPIKDNNILEKPRIDFIESWFQSIVGQTMQSDFNTSGSVFLQYTLRVPLTHWYKPQYVSQFWSSFHRSVGCLNGSIGNIPTLESVPSLQVR
jgi:hypothetical protein